MDIASAAADAVSSVQRNATLHATDNKGTAAHPDRDSPGGIDARHFPQTPQRPPHRAGNVRSL